MSVATTEQLQAGDMVSLQQGFTALGMMRQVDFSVKASSGKWGDEEDDEEETVLLETFPAVRGGLSLAHSTDTPTKLGGEVDIEAAVPVEAASQSASVNLTKGSRFRLQGSTRGSRDVARRMVARIEEGLEEGVEPEACQEGLGGTYFFKDVRGKKVAVMKPADEEPMAPNNPKGFVGRAMGEPGMKQSVRVGEAAAREVAAFLLDHGRFAGVPRTALVKAQHPIFHCADIPRYERGDGLTKLGSLQEYVHHQFDASEHGTSRFPADSVHRIGILDLRIFNTDRHSGNILVREREAQRGASGAGGIPRQGHKSLANLTSAAFRSEIDQSGIELVPIDHGYAFPETLEAAYFEWLHWPQASLPFSESELTYIAGLNARADAEMLRAELPGMLRQASLRIVEVCTTMLQRAAAAGLCLAEIGNVMSRPIVGMDEEPSELEKIFVGAQAELEGEWEDLLAERESLAAIAAEGASPGDGSPQPGGIPPPESPSDRASDAADDMFFNFDGEDASSHAGSMSTPVGSPSPMGGLHGYGEVGTPGARYGSGSSISSTPPLTPTPALTSPIRIRRNGSRKKLGQASQLSFESEEGVGGMASTFVPGAAGAFFNARLGKNAASTAKKSMSTGHQIIDNALFSDASEDKWQLFMEILTEHMDIALSKEYWKSNARLQLVTEHGTRVQNFGTSCPIHVLGGGYGGYAASHR